ncbi:MAG: hypothetical protein HC902_01105 [Calothrix sp. SM1_5_4]|nr:hypothetical protein [Calothrix sp. SM1_5_4]
MNMTTLNINPRPLETLRPIIEETYARIQPIPGHRISNEAQHAIEER